MLNLCFGKKWILLKRLMGRPTAARYFPCKLLFEENNLSAGLRQERRSQGARETASHNSDGIVLPRVGILMTIRGHTALTPAVFAECPRSPRLLQGCRLC